MGGLLGSENQIFRRTKSNGDDKLIKTFIVTPIAYLLAIPLLLKRQLSYSVLANEIRIAASRIGGAQIGKGVTLRPGVLMKGCKNICIGDNVFIGENSSLVAYGGKIIIGSDTIIADFVYISGRNHRFRTKSKTISAQGYKSGDVVIGRDVWLAHGAQILAGSTISDGTVISAGVIAPKFTNPYQVILQNGIGERI